MTWKIKATMQEGKGLKIFVVEDDQWYREFLQYHLSLNQDYEVRAFETGKDCIQNLTEMPDIITVDYRLPDMDGRELIEKIKGVHEEIEVVVISEQDEVGTAIELLNAGAYDYIVKTKDIRDKLVNTINNISKSRDLKKQVNRLQREVGKKYDFQNMIIGQSEPMKNIYALLEKAVKTDITVSITGETGTGKELIAKALHFNSKRKNAPFVPVNIAAVPKDLVESELFGHEKGSYTGAANKRIGRFEEADGGTIFLDEVADIELHMQVKLLRVLQEKEFCRVGSNKILKTNCRVVVATNKNLMEEVKKGRFREDLYYRLLGLNIHLPPLRERGKDILLLSKHFINDFVKENELEPKQLSQDAQKKLLGYNFPGNVRELRSMMELSVILSTGETIEANDITFQSVDIIRSPEEDGETTLRNYIRRLIKQYLKKYNNDVMAVASKLDIGKSTIYRMLQEEKKVPDENDY
jgi:two-component system, NtrC family, response regulator AtoC